MRDELRCTGCRTPIDPQNIDQQRELASCSNCGRLMDLRRMKAPPAETAFAPGKARTRAAVELPTGLSVDSGARVVIRRHWLRRKHWFLLFVLGVPAVYVAYLWATIGASAWLIVGTLFV